MGEAIIGLPSTTIPDLAKEVASHVKNGSFEEMIELYHYNGLNDKTKIVLRTALLWNMGITRNVFYKKNFDIELVSHGNYELKKLSEEQVVDANQKIGKLNQPFEEAMKLVANYKTTH